MAKLSERVQEQQARRTRRPLPPSHPRPAAPPGDVEAESHEQTAEVIDLTMPEVSQGGQAEPSPATSVVQRIGGAERTEPESAPGESPAATEPSGAARGPRKKSIPPAGMPDAAVPLEPRQIWLDQQNDLWLSECEYANVRKGGRKVISRSAVVRLALDRLRDTMTPEQITGLLAAREPIQAPRGRPRR